MTRPLHVQHVAAVLALRWAGYSNGFIEILLGVSQGFICHQVRLYAPDLIAAQPTIRLKRRHAGCIGAVEIMRARKHG